MIISLNWLKKYVDIDVATDELVALIGARLVEVEAAIDLAPKYKDATIVKVEEHHKIDGSDHLNLCQVDVGKKELVQVVCGANNVKTGMLAVWLPPKSVVPETYGTDDEFMLDSRKLMGQMSNGMLASMRELGLGDEHDGIVEIAPDFAKPGDSFAEKFGLNDTLLDIDPKSLTHRPDCFGVIGFAREVAGILGQQFDEPKILASKLKALNAGNLSVEICDTKLCPRYSAAVVDMKEMPKSSGFLTQDDVILCKAGMRPISHIVDVTNRLMLDTGQPLHAFDYDKFVKVGGVKNPKIIVRAAQPGEKLGLLDGKEIIMCEGDIVITSNNVPVALAGAMGGANTEIDKTTRRIIIESASFNLYNLRGTQFRHGIFSEAITRFTKGQPAGLTAPVLSEAVAMTGGRVLDVVDAYPKPVKIKPITVTVEQINAALGTNYIFDDMITTLENVGFKVNINNTAIPIIRKLNAIFDEEERKRGEIPHDHSIQSGVDTLTVVVPWWRTDIHIPEDIIEEVGRLNGYDNIPLKLPTRGYTMVEADELGDLKSKIRQILSSAGANEILTYSFVSERLLNQVGQDPKNSYKIINSISPELQYVRQQILPNLFEKAKENIKDGYEKFALFEMNQVFWKNAGLTNEKVPIQYDNLGVVIIDTKDRGNYYTAKNYVTQLAASLGVDVKFVPRKKSFEVETYFELKRAADLFIGDDYVGNVAEIKNSIADKFKLPHDTAAIEMGVDLILTAVKKSVSEEKFDKKSQFPEVNRDLTFQVKSSLEYAKLEDLIRENLGTQKLWFQINPVSIYQGDDKSTKNISFKLTFASYDKTLNGDEINQIISQITKRAQAQLKAVAV
ncbi:phenylalanine--tRNA ligase subunit beta [Candidatus Saccharibacteria bacterium]|nr:phenylalanine--tRNA ligase subunit beta [Candidatus Saccharibacteria bacterium]